MTREEFIAYYCERSRISWPELSRFRDALPCACGEIECQGWAMFPKDESIVSDDSETT